MIEKSIDKPEVTFSTKYDRDKGLKNLHECMLEVLNEFPGLLEEDAETFIDAGDLISSLSLVAAQMRADKMFHFVCDGCKREESICSADPCKDVIADREAES